ncbi:MAG: DNA topoisomerase III [Verrucomicrobiota bacterium]
MSKTLVIAEKPSVAADLARALGGKAAKAEFFEVDDYIITSAVGHLVELCLPNKMTGGKGLSWKLDSLPIIPEEFELQPIARSADRLAVVKRLLKKPEVTSVINACDAGREGELIFHNIIQLTGCKKPVKRLWLQSMTKEAIQEGFAHLRDDAEMQPLAAAAVCRSESDWLVGINSTRALTAVNSGQGGFQLTPVGRVQTPTLAILVEREEKIRAFVPKTYFEVHGVFSVAAGSYPGRWFDESFKKSEGEADSADKKAERLWDHAAAEAIRTKCEGKPGVIEETKKSTSQASPLLYDLTTLQREANGRFGFSAKRTLQLAQRLYEHHKVLTYPRTDSRYLPEDSMPAVKAAFKSFEDKELRKHAEHALTQNWVIKTGKVFNNAKVSDHHAIIPTGASIAGLDEVEAKLFQMVAQRFVAVFYPPARFDVTTRITRVEEEPFKSEGKVLTDPGWQAVYGKHAVAEGEEDAKTLVPVAGSNGALEAARTDSLQVHETQTRPPARYNEATLLSAMEGAGKLVEDEELREAMSLRGLGTPATRAAIIEGLLGDGYVLREGRDLTATSKGMALVNLLKHMGVAVLTSPELTGDWEHKLKQMEAGEFQRPEFMEEIRVFTRDIITKAQGFTDDAEGAFPDLEVVCPKCGKGPFKENVRQFKCRNCDLSLWKSLAGRPLERPEITELLTKKAVGPLDGFRSRFGKPFSAELEFDPEFKLKFVFGEREGDPAAEEALRNSEAIAPCPVCKKGTIRGGVTSYVCDQSIGTEKSCEFRTGKTILQRSIPREEIVKLAETGRTNLIAGFVSKKGRKFAAYLKLDEKKVSFEFEPREPKAPKAGGAEGEGSTVKRGRFGKPLKPNLTTDAVAVAVEKKAAKASKTTKPKKAAVKKTAAKKKSAEAPV